MLQPPYLSTLHEPLASRRTLLAKGRREVNIRTIVGTAIEQRKLVDAAVKATATVRRDRTSSSKTKVDDSGWGSLRGIDSSKPVAFDEEMECAGMNTDLHLTVTAAALLGAPQRPRADIGQMEQAALRIMEAIGVQVLVITRCTTFSPGPIASSASY